MIGYNNDLLGPICSQVVAVTLALVLSSPEEQYAVYGSHGRLAMQLVQETALNVQQTTHVVCFNIVM